MAFRQTNGVRYVLEFLTSLLKGPYDQANEQRCQAHGENNSPHLNIRRHHVKHLRDAWHICGRQ